MNTAPDFPTPWTFQQWLEWCEWHAVRNLARGVPFMIAAQAAHPMRSRVLALTSPRSIHRYELGHRAARALKEANK